MFPSKTESHWNCARFPGLDPQPLLIYWSDFRVFVVGICLCHNRSWKQTNISEVGQYRHGDSLGFPIVWFHLIFLECFIVCGAFETRCWLLGDTTTTAVLFVFVFFLLFSLCFIAIQAATAAPLPPPPQRKQRKGLAKKRDRQNRISIDLVATCGLECDFLHLCRIVFSFICTNMFTLCSYSQFCAQANTNQHTHTEWQNQRDLCCATVEIQSN